MGNSAEHKYRVFHSLCASLASGVVRVYRAKILKNTVTIAVLKANVINPPEDEELKSYLYECGLTKTSPAELEAFDYVTNASYLVYATAIFDSFLSDVTKFLVYCNPSAVKDGITADYDEIFNANNIGELKEHLISKKVRRISYQSFEDRLKFLRKTFGLKIEVGGRQLMTLRDISSVRNALAHDQSFIDLRFDADGNIESYQRSCAYRPVHVTDELFGEAWGLYTSICKKVYDEVVNRVIKYEDKELAKGLDVLFEAGIFERNKPPENKK